MSLPASAQKRQPLEGRHFDCVIIGAGMSGLAAGIRLAHFGKSVLILERHNAPGGLNSYYSLGGRRYDVGLHAMTNYVPPGTKGSPLGKLLRQLRLPREAFDLHEQKASRCTFGGASLRFSNDPALLASEIARLFPAESDGYRRLLSRLHATDETALDAVPTPASAILREYLREPLLVNLLLLPLLYYGSARENDMDWPQFVIMFKSIYLEGFARPREGVVQILRTLTKKYAALGGERRMGLGVRRIHTRDRRATALELDNGETLHATHVLSSAGRVETLRLCAPPPADLPAPEAIGRLSFVETITLLDQPAAHFGWEDTIVFFNATDTLSYARPETLVDLRSGVICLPDNYRYPADTLLPTHPLRVTAIANHALWRALSAEDYAAAKAMWFPLVQQEALRHLGGAVPADRIAPHTLATDMFTPCTIERFTGHLGGAVYGSPDKSRDGRTPFQNLHLIGTDQGFLGIVGAMLSGISMANYHILSQSE